MLGGGNMGQKEYLTIYYLKCKKEGCGKRIQVPGNFGAREAKAFACCEGHVNKYSGSDVQTHTRQVRIGR